MTKDTPEIFDGKQNSYDSSPITLANQICAHCATKDRVHMVLFSGQLLPAEEGPFLEDLTGAGNSVLCQNQPAQMEVLLFLGKHSSCMTDPAIVLSVRKIRNNWQMKLCRHTKR